MDTNQAAEHLQLNN